MEGKLVSHFRILSKLGQGGMGVVYKAEDIKLGRIVAIKVLPPALVRDEKRRVRFITEARTAAAVNHANIATIYEIDEADDFTFIALEHLDGHTLRERLAVQPLRLGEAIDLGRQIAEGLGAAHHAKIVHRDLKPENIMVTREGHAKILDFGLARLLETPEDDDGMTTRVQSQNLTEPMSVMGTPGYMSPEQARGFEVDFRTDIFSFGCVFYEMLVGRAPFQGISSADTISHILTLDPAPVANANPEIPTSVQWILDKCLAKDRKDRYQDTRDLVVDVRHLERDSQSLPSLTSVPSVTGSWPAGTASRGVPVAPRTTAAAQTPSGWTTPGGGVSKPRGRRLKPLIAAGVLVLVAALTLPRLFGGRDVVAPEAQANSLAIFAFENLSEREDPQRYGQIFQDVLITALSGLEPLKVYSGQRLFDLQKQLSGTDARAFDKDVATAVARQAGAEHMLTGSLGRLGEKWILNCQMVNVSDGSVAFSKRIDGADLYEIADLLTAALKQDLKIVAPSEVASREISVRDKTTSSMDAYRDYFEGQELLNNNKYREAAEKFRNAVAADPTFGQAHYKLALAVSWPGDDPRAAQDILKNLLDQKLYSSDKDRMLAEASLARLDYNFSEALPINQALVHDYPDEKEAWYELGETLFHSPEVDRQAEALEAFEKALQLDPDFELAYQHIFDVEWNKKNWDTALQRAEGMIRRQPESPLGYRFKAATQAHTVPEDQIDAVVAAALPHLPAASDKRALYATIATKLTNRGFFAKRDEYFRKALEADPDHDDPSIERALTQSMRGSAQWDQFETWVRERLRAHPNNTPNLWDLFSVLQVTRRHPEALAEARRLVREFPEEVEWYAEAARFAIMAGNSIDIQAALAASEAVAETPEDKIQICMTIAIAYVDVGELNRAVRFVERAMAVNPDFYAVQAMLGRVELFRGRYAASETALERATMLAPKNPQPYFARMELAYARGDTAASIAAFSQAIELLPPGIWSEIRDAALAAWDHRIGEAMLGLDRFLARPNPDHEKFEVMNNFGKVLHDFGHLDEAEGLFQRASALDIATRESTAFNNLGMVSMHRGQYDAAETRLRSATEARYANGQAHQWRALNAVLRGDLRLAEQILQAENRIEPRIGLSKIAVLIECERGDFAAARTLAEKCVAADSTRISHELLAWVLTAGGLDLERGVSEAQQALTLPIPVDREYKLPCWPPAEHSLGLAALERGDAEAARAFLRQASERSPARASLQADLRRAQNGVP